MILEHLILREIGCHGQCRLGFFTELQVSYILMMSNSGLIDIVSDSSSEDSGQDLDLSGSWCRLTPEGKEFLYYLNGKALESVFPYEDGESATDNHI